MQSVQKCSVKINNKTLLCLFLDYYIHTYYILYTYCLHQMSFLVSSPPPPVADAPTTPDPVARFRGLGTNFRAKLIGIDDVPDSRGDQMCQESIIKLKVSIT